MSQYLQATDPVGRNPITIPALHEMRRRGEKIAALTCYDASFTALLDRSGVELILVGDSMGNVVQGQSTPLPVTIDDVAYHTRCVSRGNKSVLIAADLPFGTYATPYAAFDNSVKLMQAGAHIVKLEGGEWLADTVSFLAERGIPVFAHLGLTPQSVHTFGGFKVQAKTASAAERLKTEALVLQEAGASLCVLEAVPADVGKDVTGALQIPTIGIGAGPHCSGQILVLHDMLGVFPGKTPRFVRNFMTGEQSLEAAVRRYVSDVKNFSFPAAEHCY